MAQPRVLGSMLKVQLMLATVCLSSTDKPAPFVHLHRTAHTFYSLPQELASARGRLINLWLVEWQLQLSTHLG